MKSRFSSQALLENVGVPLAAIFVSLLIGALFILGIGQNPFYVYAQLFQGTFGDSYSIGQVLYKATPLILTGLAVALGFRAGLFNIGADGQLYIGAFFTAVAGGWIPNHFPGLPSLIVVPLCMLAGFIGGGLWGVIPGILKAKLGVHEVINTIMMNFIAYGLTNYLVLDVYSVPETVHTPPIGDTAQIARLDSLIGLFHGSPVNVSIFLSLFCAFFVYILLWKMRLGYELRAVGQNPGAAEYAGIHVGWIITLTMFLSGGLAGLVGVNFVQGYKYYFEDGFATGAGFMGIAVALVGRNHPIGIILAALLFGTLSQGGLAINTLVPKELVEILQAIVIIVMVVMTEVFRRWVRRRPVPAPA